MLTMIQTISEVLREQCKINHQSFFLAVLTEDGHTVYFTGPNKLPEGEIQRYFDMDRFIRYQKRAAESEWPSRNMVVPDQN